MKPIPEPLYHCKHCADECSLPASDLFWSSEDEAWVCDECWDNGDTEEEKGVCLADAIAQAQAEHDAQVIEGALYDLSTAFRYEFEGNYGLSEVEDFIHNHVNQLHQKAQEADLCPSTQ